MVPKIAKHAMQVALDAAWKHQILTFPNPSVGAVCWSKDKGLISVGAHQYAGGPHAEVLALQAAFAHLTGNNEILSLKNSFEIHEYLLMHHGGIFKDISLSVTLEPCSHKGKTPSCALLLNVLKPKEIYIGCLDSNPIAEGGAKILQDSGVKVNIGILETACKTLLEPFNKWSKGSFVFFKWAQRMDGTIDNGVISTLESRKHVHALRNCCDLIVIGGSTVREDEPYLDARLVNGKAPDVLILSNRNDFDRTLPLFNVPNRRVFIESTLDRMKEYSLIMIEGGPNMFSYVKDFVDWYLVYIAPKIGNGAISIGQTSAEFEVLHAFSNGDMQLWMKSK